MLKNIQNKIRKNKLISNASVYVIGNTLQKALTFFMIPLYTRFLTPEDYGITGLAVAVGSIITIILGFGISGSVTRHYYDYKDNMDELKEYITSSYLFLILVAGIISLVINFFGGTLWSLMMSGNVPFSPYIQIVLWGSLADLLGQIPLSLYQTQQKARSFIIFQVGRTVLTLLLTILFIVVMHLGARGFLLGSMVASVTTTTVLSVLLFSKWFSIHFNWKYVWISLMFGLPLVPHALSSWMLGSIDRMLLEPRVSLSELGLYNLGYQIGGVMVVLVSSINLAWTPYYFNLVKTDTNSIVRIKLISELYLAFIGAICLIGVLFSPEILHILVPVQYQLAARYTPLILFSYLFNGYYYFASMPLFYFKKTFLIPIATISSAALNILLNLWWIPKSGALGSAWATFVVYVLLAVVAYFLGKRLQKVDYPLKRFAFVNSIIFVGVLLSTYGIGINNFGLVLIKTLVLVIFFLFAFFSLVKPNLRQFVH